MMIIIIAEYERSNVSSIIALTKKTHEF